MVHLLQQYDTLREDLLNQLTFSADYLMFDVKYFKEKVNELEEVQKKIHSKI